MGPDEELETKAVAVAEEENTDGEGAEIYRTES